MQNKSTRGRITTPGSLHCISCSVETAYLFRWIIIDSAAASCFTKQPNLQSKPSDQLCHNPTSYWHQPFLFPDQTGHIMWCKRQLRLPSSWLKKKQKLWLWSTGELISPTCLWILLCLLRVGVLKAHWTCSSCHHLAALRARLITSNQCLCQALPWSQRHQNHWRKGWKLNCMFCYQHESLFTSQNSSRWVRWTHFQEQLHGRSWNWILPN